MKCIICAEMNNKDNLFIENISPIIWTDNINNAKSFSNYKETITALDYEFRYLSNVVKRTDIYGIFIFGINDNGYKVGELCYL